MDLYLFTLVLSFCALMLMVLLGMTHHSPGKGTSAHGHGHGPGHAHGHGQAKDRGPVHIPGMKVHETDSRHSLGATLLATLSPRTLFSFLLGFGATGLLLHPLVRGSALGLFALAILGGWAFETFLVNPFGQFLFRFASTPARMLDTMALEEGRAATDFDAAGHGLITVALDGQVRQVLSRLIPDERGPGAPRVRTGDRLFIRAVDRQRNTCTVSRLDG